MNKPVSGFFILICVSSRKSFPPSHETRGPSPLATAVADETEAGRAVAEGRDEDRHVALVRLVQDRVVALRAALLLDVLAERLEELAAAVRPRLHLVDDELRLLVAEAEFVLVDEGVVDAVDRVLAQLAVEHAALVLSSAT
jgi:hypothetical protein